MNEHESLQSVQAVGEVHSMDALPPDAFDFPRVRSGDIVDGYVVSISRSELLVDIGYKADAIVDGRELDRLEPEFLDGLSVGDPVVAYVVQTEDRDGNVVISLTRALQEKDWRRAEAMLDSQDTFSGVVTGHNRGGIIVQMGSLRGFVPASQLSGRWQAQQDTEADPEQRWVRLIGQEMQFKILELDRRRNRLILSERAAMREWRQSQKEHLLSTLEKGDIVEGIVTSIANFGAFVDLGGADGLIHLSELSWQRVAHPSEIVQVGQKIKVSILNVDTGRQRIGLSLRRTQPEPWSIVDERYVVGQIVPVTITKLTNFGAFASLDDAIEGLIHISELTDYRVDHPKEIVQTGDQLDVRIIRIDPQRRRMGLSLRLALEEAWVEVDWRDDETNEDDQGDEDETVNEQILAGPEPLTGQ